MLISVSSISNGVLLQGFLYSFFSLTSTHWTEDSILRIIVWFSGQLKYSSNHTKHESLRLQVQQFDRPWSEPLVLLRQQQYLDPIPVFLPVLLLLLLDYDYFSCLKARVLELSASSSFSDKNFPKP
jgi:hypothetical protein